MEGDTLHKGIRSMRVLSRISNQIWGSPANNSWNNPLEGNGKQVEVHDNIPHFSHTHLRTENCSINRAKGNISIKTWNAGSQMSLPMSLVFFWLVFFFFFLPLLLSLCLIWLKHKWKNISCKSYSPFGWTTYATAPLGAQNWAPPAQADLPHSVEKQSVQTVYCPKSLEHKLRQGQHRRTGHNLLLWESRESDQEKEDAVAQQGGAAGRAGLQLTLQPPDRAGRWQQRTAGRAAAHQAVQEGDSRGQLAARSSSLHLGSSENAPSLTGSQRRRSRYSWQHAPNCKNS